MSLADTPLGVWRQALAESAEDVKLNGRHFPCSQDAEGSFHQVDFYCGDEAVSALIPSLFGEHYKGTVREFPVSASPGYMTKLTDLQSAQG